MKPAVNSVLMFVLNRYVTTESYQDGLNKGTRAKFHMEPEQLMDVLKFIMEKEGCTVEQAMQGFTTCRDSAMQAKAKSPGESGPFFGVLISLLLSVGPGILLSLLEIKSLWFNVFLAVLVPTLFFVLFYLLVWSPRYKEKTLVWEQGGTLVERMQRLYEVEQLPLQEILMERQRGKTMAFVIAAVLCIGGFGFLAGANAKGQADFHENLAGVTVSADNKGTRYAVYDVDKERYVDGYLTKDLQALTADDVLGVFRISEGEEKYGSYTGGGTAYKRYVSIRLVDQRTGDTVATKTVYGGNPPDTIVSRNPFSSKNGYGSKPDKDDITRTCIKMITDYEKKRAEEDFNQKMSKVTVSKDNTGTRYVVYDEETEVYVNKYLSQEHQALEPEDVRGVLTITSGKLEVGSYSGGIPAYQRYVIIALVDQRTGEEKGSEFILGGDPPKTIYSFASEGNGDLPTDSEISTACEKLISQFEGK